MVLIQLCRAEKETMVPHQVKAMKLVGYLPKELKTGRPTSNVTIEPPI